MIRFSLKGKMSTNQVWLNGKLLNPQKSQLAYNHSPDGFNWGYGGSGASQLALAVLLELLPTEKAKANYMQFKWDEIAVLPQTDFEKDIHINY